MNNKGLLICAMGIPGCGKSSVVRALADLYGEKATSYYEPEENDSKYPWPPAVHKRSEYGYFGSITWFRAMRVPGLIDAELDKQNGKIAFVDSYFDKLIYKYIGAEGLEWFLPKNDEYYDIVNKMAKRDYEKLPNADIVLCFTVTKDIWRKFLSARSRAMDKEETFEKECFSLQQPMIDACKSYKEDYKKFVIYIEQENTSPFLVAEKLKAKIDMLYEKIY